MQKEPVEASGTRAVVIWANFGLYHFARAAAIASVCDLVPIELASHQHMYGWQVRSEVLSTQLITLAEGSLEDQSQLALSIKLWNALQVVQPSIVFIPGYATLPSLTAGMWSRWRGRRAVMMTESNLNDYPRRPLFERLKRMVVSALFDAALVGGRRAADYAHRLGIPMEKIYFRYNVVDNEWFEWHANELRAQKVHPENLPTDFFLFVGRLAPEKNLLRLLSAFHKYVTTGGRWDLIIVGRGPLESVVASAVRDYDLSDRVRLEGFKNGDQIIPYYAFARCFVLPSVREPWGLVVNEAMACGLPVICSVSCGAYDDLIVEGETGFGVRPDDSANLAATLHRMSDMDSAERIEMGRRAQLRMAKYSPRALSLEAMRVIQELSRF